MADFGARPIGGMRYIAYYTVSVTLGTNSKGSWAQLVASLPQSADFLVLTPYGADSAENMLWDIGIGGAGSEVVLVPNIFGQQYSSASDKSFALPVHIDAGTRIAIRGQGSVGGTRTFKVLAYSSDLASVKGYTKFGTFGADTANSRGTAAASGAPGTWAEISSSLPFNISGGVLSVSTESPTAGEAAFTVEIGIGAAGSEIVIGRATFVKRSYGNVRIWTDIPVSIPSGTRLAVRQATASGGTATMLFTGY